MPSLIAPAWDSVLERTRGGFCPENVEPPWKAFAGPQTMAEQTEAHELFFGGSAGGGKSDLLLGLAITSQKRSIIYRREARQSSAFVTRSREILGRLPNWAYNGSTSTWRSDDGKVIEFAGAQHEWDWTKHQGHPFDMVSWDELSHFTRLQYRILNGWNRTSEPGQRCRVVATGNPPTSPEGRWVVEEFAPWLDKEFPNPAAPGELRWYVVEGDKVTWLESGEEVTVKGERIKPRSRTFIPARVTDNPVYMATDYVSTLQALPEPMRSQFLYGDFGAGMEEDPWQVIPTDWVRKAFQRWTEEPPCEQSALGVDVARGGRDKTTIAPRHGKWFAKLHKHPGSATPDGPTVAGLVINVQRGKATVFVDVIGVGASVYDYLKEQSWFRTVPVNNAGACELKDRSGKLRFVNVRAASYWKLREALDPNGPDRIALPPDQELLADLCAPKWKLTSRGVQIEAKEDLVKRLGRSPDTGDAVVLGWWSNVIGSGKPRDLRVISTGGSVKQNGPRILAGSFADLLTVSAQQRTLLVVVRDPGEEPSLPEHGFSVLIGSAVVSFADLDPAELQDRWLEPMPPWNETLDKLVATREHAKKVWGLLTRRRDPQAEIWCFADSTDGRRAVSAAVSVAETLGRKRGEVDVLRTDMELGNLNRHVVETIRAGRALVV